MIGKPVTSQQGEQKLQQLPEYLGKLTLYQHILVSARCEDGAQELSEVCEPQSRVHHLVP